MKPYIFLLITAPAFGGAVCFIVFYSLEGLEKANTRSFGALRMAAVGGSFCAGNLSVVSS
jgi:hypothetical protein